MITSAIAAVPFILALSACSRYTPVCMTIHLGVFDREFMPVLAVRLNAITMRPALYSTSVITPTQVPNSTPCSYTGAARSMSTSPPHPNGGVFDTVWMSLWTVSSPRLVVRAMGNTVILIGAVVPKLQVAWNIVCRIWIGPMLNLKATAWTNEGFMHEAVDQEMAQNAVLLEPNTEVPALTRSRLEDAPAEVLNFASSTGSYMIDRSHSTMVRDLIKTISSDRAPYLTIHRTTLTPVRRVGVDV